MVVGKRVLAQVYVPLLQPEHVEGVETVGADAKIRAGFDEGVPQLRAARPRVVQLERELPDESDAERAARDAGDRDLAVPRVRDRRVVDGIVGETREHVSCEGPGHVDGAEHRRLVHEMDVQVPAVGPLEQPRLHRIGAARRRGDVVPIVVQGAEEAVVHDVPRLAERQEVPAATRSETEDPACEDAVDKRLGVPAADQELPERADVHHRHPLSDGSVLLFDLAVEEWPHPASGPVHVRPELEMSIVQRGPSLHRFVDASHQVLEAHRPRRRTCRRARAGSIRTRSGPGERGDVPPAHRALTRPHRRRRVPLQDL